MTKQIPILSMDDPDFIDKFVDATGIERGSTIEIRTPQFERLDDVIPFSGSFIPFDHLHSMTKDELIALGMVNWDGRLWLFPYQWHKDLPKGMVVRSINGQTCIVGQDYIDDDRRGGVLAYGIIPNFIEETK